MGEFVKVCKVSDIPNRRAKPFIVGEDEVAVFNVAGKFYVIDNVCPHQHTPAMFDGIVEGLNVSCPMHGWTYNLETGNAVSGAACIRTFNLKVEGGEIFVETREPPSAKW